MHEHRNLWNVCDQKKDIYKKFEFAHTKVLQDLIVRDFNIVSQEKFTEKLYLAKFDWLNKKEDRSKLISKIFL